MTEGVQETNRRKFKKVELSEANGLPDPNAAGEFEHVDDKDAARELLGQLSDKQREVLEATYLQDKSAKETADDMNTTPEEVDRLKKKAIRNLRVGALANEFHGKGGH